MKITVRNRDFIEEYRNLQSPTTRALIEELTVELVRFFKGLHGDSFEGIEIISLFEGSVGVNFELSLKPSSNVTNTTVVEQLKRSNGTQALGFLELGEISAVEQIPEPTTQTTVMTLPTASGMCLVTGRNRFFLNFTSLFSNRHQLTNKPDAYGALTGSFSAAGHRPLYKNSNRI